MLGLLGVAFGTGVAYASRRYRGHVEALETGAGVLLIGGLFLAGCALHVLL